MAKYSNIFPNNWWHIRQASRKLKQGGIIAYPTEAVWGISCDPFNKHAVLKLLKIKQRSMDKGLILVAGNISQFKCLLDELSVENYEKISKDWPGPKTWIIPDHKNKIPPWIKGKHSTVAIRVSAHYLSKNIANSFGGFIVSTSANISNFVPARDSLKVRTYFGGVIDYFVMGETDGESRPTEIKDMATNRTLRC